MTEAENKAAMELLKPLEQAPTLAFDAATHTYRINGQSVPSVTQILAEAGLIDGQWYTDESQLRGRTVHIITALHDRDELDESKVADEYKGYLTAWRKLQADTQCEVFSVERRICNFVYRYAGTMDRLVRWNGVLYLVDLKTGATQWWHKIQTAAYWMCHDIPAACRCAIYLSPDGSYKIKIHEAHAYDTDVFRAALTLANAKRNEGITNDRDRSN